MKQNNQQINRWRNRGGVYGSTNKDKNNGAFRIPGPAGQWFLVIASDQLRWEHVSVSVMGENRCPTWEEMCFIKDVFWAKDEVVIQYHPAEAEYVRAHPYALHLWKPIGVDLPTPPPEMVGPLCLEKKA